MRPTDRYRLAIAAIEPERVLDVVSDLGANGLTSSDLCLAAAPERLNRVAQLVPSASKGVLSPLLAVEPLPLGSPAGVLATTNRPMTSLMNVAGASAPTAERRPCWLDAASRAALMDLIMQGQVLIVAGPLSAAQLQAGTNVLLRHSNHPVQGHLFNPPSLTPRG